MLSNKKKKEFVEQGIKEFAINPKFRELLKWLVHEFDKIYDARLEQIKTSNQPLINLWDNPEDEVWNKS